MTEPSHIYLIESECGRIKVGCSKEPAMRLATFAANSPRPLRLIAIWQGGYADEKAIHEQFRSYRTHNEWFRPDGAFLDFVNARRGTGVGAILPWVSLEWASAKERANAKRAAAQKATRSDPVWKAEQERARAWRKALSRERASLGRNLSSHEFKKLYAMHHGEEAAEMATGMWVWQPGAAS